VVSPRSPTKDLPKTASKLRYSAYEPPVTVSKQALPKRNLSSNSSLSSVSETSDTARKRVQAQSVNDIDNLLSRTLTAGDLILAAQDLNLDLSHGTGGSGMLQPNLGKQVEVRLIGCNSENDWSADGLYSGKRRSRASSRLIRRFTLNLQSMRSILLASTYRLTRSTPAPTLLAIRSIVIHPPTLSSPRWICLRRPLLRRRHLSRIANSSTFGLQSQVQRHREGDGVRVVLWRYMSIWLGRSSLNCGECHSTRNPTKVRLPFELNCL